MEKFGWFLQNIFIPVVTAGTATMVVWLNHSVKKVDQNLQEQMTAVDIALKEGRNEREKLALEREFNFKIYDLVQESIEEKDERKQEVAKQFIIVMVDGELRRRLLGVLEAGGTDSIQKETARLIKKEDVFHSQEAEIYTRASEIKTQPSRWQDWHYDIFWCEASGESAKNQATIVAQQLKDNGAKGRVRVRELPASVNAKAGYKISGYAIRRNSDEEAQAKDLKEISEKALSSRGYSAVFDLQLSKQNTKWYITAFVCP